MARWLADAMTRHRDKVRNTSILHYGMPLPALTFRDYAAIGVAPWAPLARIIPDPLLEESAAAQRAASRHAREHAALRSEVQRLLKGTAKGRNVDEYALYIALGIQGKRGRRWSTPPLCLWSSEPLTFTEDNTVTGYLPLTAHVVAVDGEAQVAALHQISEDPGRYELAPAQIDELRVPFELYWDISADDARQIFHDRNWHGVPVAKTLALSMDQFDLATGIAQRLMADVKVSVDGRTASLSEFVSLTKRQVSGPEWITLSGLRSLVTTTLLGRPGIAASATAVSERSLPSGVDADEAAREATGIIAEIITSLAGKFAAGTAITAPACLAGIGVAAHEVMPWSADEGNPRRTSSALLDIHNAGHWERDPDVWDGIAGRRTPAGAITFGGGVKDSGGRVADALLNPDSPAGRQIRRRGLA